MSLQERPNKVVFFFYSKESGKANLSAAHSKLASSLCFDALNLQHVQIRVRGEGRRRMNLQLGRNHTINPALRNIWPGWFHTHINLGGPYNLPAGVVPPHHPLPSCRVWGSPHPRKWGPAARGLALYVSVFLLVDGLGGPSEVRFILSFLGGELHLEPPSS